MTTACACFVAVAVAAVAAAVVLSHVIDYAAARSDPTSAAASASVAFLIDISISKLPPSSINTTYLAISPAGPSLLAEPPSTIIISITPRHRMVGFATMPPRSSLTSSFSITDSNNEVVCPLRNQDGSSCRKRCLGVG